MNIIYLKKQVTPWGWEAVPAQGDVDEALVEQLMLQKLTCFADPNKDVSRIPAALTFSPLIWNPTELTFRADIAVYNNFATLMKYLEPGQVATILGAKDLWITYSPGSDRAAERNQEILNEKNKTFAQFMDIVNEGRFLKPDRILSEAQFQAEGQLISLPNGDTMVAVPETWLRKGGLYSNYTSSMLIPNSRGTGWVATNPIQKIDQPGDWFAAHKHPGLPIMRLAASEVRISTTPIFPGEMFIGAPLTKDAHLAAMPTPMPDGDWIIPSSYQAGSGKKLDPYVATELLLRATSLQSGVQYKAEGAPASPGRNYVEASKTYICLNPSANSILSHPYILSGISNVPSYEGLSATTTQQEAAS